MNAHNPPSHSSAPSETTAGHHDPIGRKLVFVVTEDWFFASHFLPMARAAKEIGLDVVVVTRLREHTAAIAATGARLIPLDAERRSLNPMKAGYASGQLAAILKAEKADLVHCIALRPILVGGFAAALAGIPQRIFAPTGLGFFGARQDWKGKLGRKALRFLISLLASGKTFYLFENPDDARSLGLDPDVDARVTIVGGAGVDPDFFTPIPLPAPSPLRVGIVSRMLWSKGIDLAVEAAQFARAQGVEIELSLYGAPDPSNPKAFKAERLMQWGALPGVTWHRAIADPRKAWADNHVCCLPSRGGEGLPRTLLEGAACGRALVTTDVSGCRSFVRHEKEGLIVPPEDPQALARAFVRLARDPSLVARAGEEARRRVLEGFTEKHVAEALKDLYRRCLAD